MHDSYSFMYAARVLSLLRNVWSAVGGIVVAVVIVVVVAVVIVVVVAVVAVKIIVGVAAAAAATVVAAAAATVVAAAMAVADWSNGPTGDRRSGITGLPEAHLRTTGTAGNTTNTSTQPPSTAAPPIHTPPAAPLVTRLPDSLRSVMDQFLSLDPTSLTVDLLEQHLLAAETSAVAVGAARGTPHPPFAPTYASAATIDVPGAEDVGAAFASAKRRSGKGKGSKGGGGGIGRGGGGSSGGGGGSGGGGVRIPTTRPLG
ncbi:unnamed protein product [Closterium sp. NIES-54]